MIRQGKFSAILASVSLAALAVAINPAFAAGTTNPGSLSGNYDFVLLDDYSGGALTNDGVIGAAGTRVGISAENTTSMSGALVNNDEVYASYTDVSTATAVAGIFVEESSVIAGGIDNFGSITAYAHAGFTDDAQAEAHGIDYNATSNSGSAIAVVDNGSEFDPSGTVYGWAFASAYDSASAHAGGIDQEVQGLTGSAQVNNDGTVSAAAGASAIASGALGTSAHAIASATVVWQNVEGVDASAGVDNDGMMGAFVLSHAESTDANAGAELLGFGVTQELTAQNLVTGLVVNHASASIYATGTAWAEAADSAYATALGAGVLQIGLSGNDGSLTVDNQGNIFAGMTAIAQADPKTGDARAVAAAAGTVQGLFALDDTYVALSNDDLITAGAIASATGEHADALGVGFGAAQFAVSAYDEAITTIYNDGQIRADVLAMASSVYGTAASNAIAGGTLQVSLTAFDRAWADLVVADGGSVLAQARATATAYHSASADAYVIGAAQVSGSLFGEAITDITNDGVIDARGIAFASASDFAYAEADAAGIDQLTVSILDESTAGILNSGTIFAAGHASATAYDEAFARGGAIGINQYGASLGALSESVDNLGAITAVASGTAYATGDAHGEAGAAGVVQIAGSVDQVDLTVSNWGLLSAFAGALASGTEFYDAAEARATAHATGVAQESLTGIDTAMATVLNDSSGLITAFASATAFASQSAYAEASADGIHQYTVTVVGDATDFVDSSGLVGAQAQAWAEADDGTAEAGAGASGVSQWASSYLTGDAGVALSNDGDVYASAAAWAAGASAAEATAEAFGVNQSATAAFQDAYASVISTGAIIARAETYASSTASNAFAAADAGGIVQFANTERAGEAEALVQNLGLGPVAAWADASAYGSALASASAGALGVEQDVLANFNDATATVYNAGAIGALADAHAVASTAIAFAHGTGVDQYGSAGYAGPGEDVALHTVNDGSLIAGVALAAATGYTEASAVAHAIGVNQFAWAEEDANVYAENSGIIGAFAMARADSNISGTAEAYATATGLSQYLGGGEQSNGYLDNTGAIGAMAFAYGYNDDSYVEAEAFGTRMSFLTDADLLVDSDNGPDAIIAGMALAGGDDARALAAGSWYDGPELHGTIDNAGLVFAGALAIGDTSYATAVGIAEISDGGNDLTLTNSGIVAAMAEGDGVNSTAIAIASYGVDGAPPAGAPVGTPPPTVSTIRNQAGVIWAGASGGRGMAINTTGFTSYTQGDPGGGNQVYGAAPNQVLVELSGNNEAGAGKTFVSDFNAVSDEVQDALDAYSSYGFVYGDIEINAADEVEVTDGVTIFDGVINAQGPGDGTLDITSTGKLVMVQNDSEGPSSGSVGHLNVDGTLVYELTTSDAAGDYSQIFADTAEIDLEGSTFVALYDAGLYGDHMRYDNVIDANTLTGSFANVLDNSALLDTQMHYDGSDNADLYVERIAFDEVDGLTRNQKAAGGAIENVYGSLGPTADTYFEDMVAEMFTLNNADYQDFLDQLSGAEYAQHLQSVLHSTRAIDSIITARMECADDHAPKAGAAAGNAGGGTGTQGGASASPAAVDATGCFEPGRASIWMRGFGQLNKITGDENAPGLDEKQYGVAFGGDYAFNESVFVGLAGAYFNSAGDFEAWGGRDGSSIDYKGMQGAAYGGYDDGEYYLRGIVAYGRYDGESHRLIALDGSTVDPSGDPKSNALSFYGETGYRIPVKTIGHVAPYAGVSVARARLEGFTEDDPEYTGASLQVHESDAQSVASVLGLRLSSEVVSGSGLFAPSLAVSWMHEFGADAQSVDMSFAQAPEGADFTTVGSKTARDSVLVDAGATYTSGTVDIGVFYSGQYNAQYSSNAITARLGYKF